MIKISTKCAIVFGFSLLLLACKEQNPLLGEWSLVKTADLRTSAFKIAQISGNAKIIFEETRMISENQTMDVSYTVNGNEVTVNYTNGEKNTYVIEDGDRFVFQIPKAGTFEYVRRH